MISPLVYTLRYRPDDAERLAALAAPILPGGAASKKGHSEFRHLQFLAGRAALARAFQVLGIEEIVEADPRFGYLKTATRCINVSHTGNVAAAVVGTGSIGIDIEAVDRDATRVYRRVATAEELARLPAFCARTGLPPVALWSAKEAFSKAVGLGITFGMRDFQIILDGSPPLAGRTSLRGPLRLAEPGLVFRVEAGILISVCGEKSELASGVRWLSGQP